MLKCNNVDVRYGFPFDGNEVDIVAASQRSQQRIAVFMVDANSRTLADISNGGIQTGVYEAYGFCLYHCWKNDKYYAFIGTKRNPYGYVEQWEIYDNNGVVEGQLVASFDVGSQVEGMVADDRYGVFYVGEENVAIWRYDTDANGVVIEQSKMLVDLTGAGVNLTADVEGLCLYQATDGGGYLIASSQGNNTFVIYDRDADANNPYKFSFEVVSGIYTDGVNDSDGIDVISSSFGGQFPMGCFITQDGSNTNPSAAQDFKLVRWDDIASAPDEANELTMDISWDPRSMCGVLAGDINSDCSVDFLDIAQLAEQWDSSIEDWQIFEQIVESWLLTNY